MKKFKLIFHFGYLVLFSKLAFSTETTLDLVVDVSHYANSSPLSVNFSQTPLESAPIIALKSKAQEIISPFSKKTDRKKVRDFVFLVSNLNLFSLKNSYLVVLPEYRSQQHLIKDFKIDESDKRFGRLMDEAFFVMSERYLTQTFQADDSTDGKTGYYFNRLVSGHDKIRVDKRPSNFTVQSAVDYRNQIHDLLNRAKAHETKIKNHLSALKFPLGSKKSAQETILRYHEIQSDISWGYKAIRDAQEKSSFDRGEVGGFVTRFHDAELEAKGEKAVNKGKAELSDFKKIIFKSQMFAHILSYQYQRDLESLKAHLSFFSQELHDIDSALLSLFQKIQEESQSSIDNFSRLLDLRVSDFRLGLDQLELESSLAGNAAELLENLSDFIRTHGDLQSIEQELQAMSKKARVSLSLKKGIEVKRPMITDMQEISNQIKSEYFTKLNTQMNNIFSSYFLNGSKKLPIASLDFTKEESEKILKIWKDSEDFDDRIRLSLGLIIVGQGFWSSDMVFWLHQANERYQSISREQFGSLVLGAFSSLSSNLQNEELRGLRAYDLKLVEELKEIYKRQIILQSDRVLEMQKPGALILEDYSQSIFVDQVRQIKELLSANKTADAKTLLRDLLLDLTSLDDCFYLLVELSSSPELDDVSWEHLLDVLGVLFRSELDRDEVRHENLEFYLSYLGDQVQRLRGDLLSRAQLLSIIGLAQLKSNADETAALNILTKLRGPLDFESDGAIVYKIFLPVIEEAFELQAERQIDQYEILGIDGQKYNESDESIAIVQQICQGLAVNLCFSR